MCVCAHLFKDYPLQNIKGYPYPNHRPQYTSAAEGRGKRRDPWLRKTGTLLSELGLRRRRRRFHWQCPALPLLPHRCLTWFTQQCIVDIYTSLSQQTMDEKYDQNPPIKKHPNPRCHTCLSNFWTHLHSKWSEVFKMSHVFFIVCGS